MRIKQLSSLLTGLFLFSTLLAQAQEKGTIRGFVNNEESGEPVMFVTVSLKDEGKGTSTDEKGYYSLNKVEPGTYTLQVSGVGYETSSREVTVKPGQVLNEKFQVKEETRQMEEVKVSGRRQEQQENVKMSVERVEPDEIESMASVGGGDLAQYLQVLPGVVFTGDQGGQLYIRGGSPVQNKVLMDGMMLYQPFHSIGLSSVFDTDIIRNADIYTGGFGAQYGGRISSIMDITTRDGDKNRHQGKVSFSPLVAKTHVEGPISKSDDGESWSSFLFSAKHSYLNHSSKALYTSLPTIDENGLPFSFTDLFGKVSFHGRSGSKADLSGFRYEDRVALENLPTIEWQTYGGGGNFTIVPGSSPILMEGAFAYSQYDVEMLDEETASSDEVSDRQSQIDNFEFNLDFKYLFERDHIKYGLDIMGNSTNFSFTNFAGRRIVQEDNNTQIAGYATYKMRRGDWVFEPGFRAQYYASIPEFSPEPRLGIKYNLTEELRVKGATGIYSQNLIGTSSQQDVVNLFNGFLTAPENLQDEFTERDGSTREVNSALQKAAHYILGFEYDIMRGFHVELEGYYKDFLQLTAINHNKIFPDNPENSDRPATLRKDFIVQDGKAYGADLLVQYRNEKFRLRGVYSLAKVDRWDGVQEFAPVFDRRHNVNLLGTYRFGEGKNWEVSARWNFGSGFPFTRNQGYYERFDLEEGQHSDYVTGNGELGIVYEDINQGRLPPYHRLDLNLKRKWELSEHSTFKATLGITNAYDRRNIFFVDRITREREDQLPILPTFVTSLTF